MSELGQPGMVDTMSRESRNTNTAELVPLSCKCVFGFKSGMKRASEAKASGMDSLIAKELNQLSLEERSIIYEQIHGVSGEQVHETPEQIRELSQQLLQEIRHIRERSAFDKAFFLSPYYVSDPDFLVMFLRADDYNLKRAARRIVRHFQHKLDLFGEEKICRPIFYDDLDNDDKDALLSGRVQMLKGRRDHAGRLIVYSSEGIITYKNARNQVRFFVS